MYKKNLYISLLTIVILGVGCNTQLPPAPEQSATSHENHIAGEGVVVEDKVIEAGSRFITDKKSDDLALGSNQINFKIYDAANRELTPENLKTVHEKKLHFIMVKNDLTNFQHLHPEYHNGSWTTSANFIEAGNYIAYTDIAPMTENPVILYRSFVVGKTTNTALVFPPPTSDLKIKNETYQAALSPTHFMVNNPIELTYTLTENNSPITDLGAYLGAYGHVVALSHNDPRTFLHVHPIREQKPQNGKVLFSTTFSKAGRYTLFAQFNIRNSIKTFPITIDVVDNMAPHH